MGRTLTSWAICALSNLNVENSHSGQNSLSSYTEQQPLVYETNVEVLKTAVRQLSTSGCLQKYEKPHTHPFRRARINMFTAWCKNNFCLMN